MASQRCDEAVKTVVVVGAGAAGLEAARVLLNHDSYRTGEIKVVLLEARDRVGGRMHTDRKWGVPFDLGLSREPADSGPNWIHGTLLNPLVPIAKITSSQLTFPDESWHTIYAGSGDALAPEVSHLLYQRIWNYASEAVEYSGDPDEAIPPDWSMYDFCVARISEDEDLDDETKLLALQMMEMLTTFTAVDIRRQSLRHYQVEAELPVRVFNWL
jgi:Flavin containing amine oxidoreductase